MMRFLWSLIFGLSLSLNPALATDNHSHAKPGSSRLELDSGKKWATDAPLRSGMAGIKSAIEPMLREIHENKLTEAKYAGLAQRINSEVNSIFKNCKLSPKADAQLHLILIQIVEGANAMKSSAQLSAKRKGAIQVVEALALYPRYFEHPGWIGLKHE